MGCDESLGHAIIHDKIVVIDPLSENGAVVMGSHNLVYKASYENDENFVIIRGPRARSLGALSLPCRAARSPATREKRVGRLSSARCKMARWIPDIRQRRAGALFLWATLIQYKNVGFLSSSRDSKQKQTRLEG